jgi:hypothetical protein
MWSRKMAYMYGMVHMEQFKITRSHDQLRDRIAFGQYALGSDPIQFLIKIIFCHTILTLRSNSELSNPFC